MEEKAAVAVVLHGTPVSGTIPDTSHPVPTASGRYVHTLGGVSPPPSVSFWCSLDSAYRCQGGYCDHTAAFAKKSMPGRTLSQ